MGVPVEGVSGVVVPVEGKSGVGVPVEGKSGVVVPVEGVSGVGVTGVVLSGCGVSDGVGCSVSTVPKRVVFWRGSDAKAVCGAKVLSKIVNSITKQHIFNFFIKVLLVLEIFS